MITKNAVVLFDMDGTLTPPRENIGNNVISALRSLEKFAKIGIISGSDLEYIQEQCAAMFEVGGVDITNVDLLPCNGTKLLRWKAASYEMLHEADMIKNINPRAYKKIMRWLFEHQAEIAMLYPDVNFTGTFFQYRGSLLNWCPIGRIANNTLRYGWACQDEEWKIRETYMEELQKYLKTEKIPVTVALGGTTSFDIYPDGWNKTYGLQHYPEREIYFIGDRCEVGGNDWHIYEALKKEGRAWQTTGPENTIEIIQQLIKKLQE